MQKPVQKVSHSHHVDQLKSAEGIVAVQCHVPFSASLPLSGAQKRACDSSTSLLPSILSEQAGQLVMGLDPAELKPPVCFGDIFVLLCAVLREKQAAQPPGAAPCEGSPSQQRTSSAPRLPVASGSPKMGWVAGAGADRIVLPGHSLWHRAGGRLWKLSCVLQRSPKPYMS